MSDIRARAEDLLEADRIALSLGYSIAAWGQVEDVLCSLYTLALRTPDLISAHDAFYAIVSFEAKFSTTTAAMRQPLISLPELNFKWRTLSNRIGRKSKIRNKLAHGQIITIYSTSGPETYFIPFYTDLRITKAITMLNGVLSLKNDAKSEWMKAKLIFETHDGFIRLARDVEAFYREFAAGLRANGP